MGRTEEEIEDVNGRRDIAVDLEVAVVAISLAIGAITGPRFVALTT